MHLRPIRVAANVSRCPDLVGAELAGCFGRECELLFESRPLGVCRTLAGLNGRAAGSWFVSNTDMVVEADLGAMLEFHRRSGSDWTILAGPPVDGYRPLAVSRDGSFGGGPVRMHYWGIGIVEPGIFELAARKPGPDLFGGLAPAALDAGMKLRIFEASPGDSWLDAGDVEKYRTGLLSCGSFVHPGALIEEGARLEGSWYVGDGCFVGSGARVVDSVMLNGSRLESGGLVSSVLPWEASRRGME